MPNVKQEWLTLSIEDTNRFRRVVARGRIEDLVPPAGAIADEIAVLQAGTIIIRMPAGTNSPVQDLIGRGYVPIHADTLVYHSRPLDILVVEENAYSGLLVRLADHADSDRIAEIARKAFGSYKSHYHANPLFDSVDITEGYAEWAISFLRSPALDRETWVVRSNGNVEGFATCALSRANEMVEIVLNAIDPAKAGRGLYGYLLNQILISYRARGYTAVSSSTQVWNYTVQRAWARAGFLITKAYDTYHINTPAISR